MTHYIKFDAPGGTYQILESLSPAVFVKNPVTGQNYQVYFGAASTNGLDSMQLQSAAFNGQSVLAFDPLGVPYSCNPSTGALSALTTASVTVGSGSRQMTVAVAPFSGELTVQ